MGVSSGFDLTGQRIVVKLGTQVVTRDGVHIALARLSELVERLSAWHQDGVQVILVSSGAVGVGRRLLGLTDRPLPLGLRQACAAAGQSELIRIYHHAFDMCSIKVAQVLLTQADLANRERALCVRTTLSRLLDLGVVPILNENDSVSVRELTEVFESGQQLGFGDNDGLAAEVAVTMNADALCLLTNVDGVYPTNPEKDPKARRIDRLSLDMLSDVDASGTSGGGLGGMRSKLAAAQKASEHGIWSLIGNRLVDRLSAQWFGDSEYGTWVQPKAEMLKKRAGAVSASVHIRGVLVVNEGAARALLEDKASLLPIGVTAVEGHFECGDAVEIRDDHGRSYGVGLVNYDSESCKALRGCHSREIRARLGWKGYSALVTRSNMTLAGFSEA